MTFVRANWAIITAVVLSAIAWGSLSTTVTSHTEKLAALEQMKIDIAVIRQSVEWLKAQGIEENRKETLHK